MVLLETPNEHVSHASKVYDLHGLCAYPVQDLPQDIEVRQVFFGERTRGRKRGDLIVVAQTARLGLYSVSVSMQPERGLTCSAAFFWGLLGAPDMVREVSATAVVAFEGPRDRSAGRGRSGSVT